MIRAATPADCPAIADIWNPVIRDTLRTFTTALKTPEALVQSLAAKAVLSHPFLVADQGGILGFATYGQFRDGPGYARTMEHTIILAPQAQGRGVARALMLALEDRARAQAVHSLWAGVSAANPEGLGFHRAVGFVEVARLPEVGYKFGQWIDLILLRKQL
ncbi:GNAT family N-acetyltransferase [Pseudogemmobacter sp. W21_MBD1_M6]|uniref:GNAT family N-acetyltransferase n=1 Tax=Pseudogemmobacter sp. W21_MBD1_M6 TaxID=3240271 RepID=UPI003F96EC69